MAKVVLLEAFPGQSVPSVKVCSERGACHQSNINQILHQLPLPSYCRQSLTVATVWSLVPLCKLRMMKTGDHLLSSPTQPHHIQQSFHSTHLTWYHNRVVAPSNYPYHQMGIIICGSNMITSSAHQYIKTSRHAHATHATIIINPPALLETPTNLPRQSFAKSIPSRHSSSIVQYPPSLVHVRFSLSMPCAVKSTHHCNLASSRLTNQDILPE